MGGVGDSYGALLKSSRKCGSAEGVQEFEEAMTAFRRAEAAW